MFIFSSLFLILRCLILPRATLAAEILALRQQVAVLNRSVKRPQLHRRDRLFWIVLSKLWKGWREVLVIVKPDTVVKWHRQDFALYWRWKSKVRQVGHPPVDKEIRGLIRRMSHENPTWGTPRIQAELQLLGYRVAESTVANYDGGALELVGGRSRAAVAECAFE